MSFWEKILYVFTKLYQYSAFRDAEKGLLHIEVQGLRWDTASCLRIACVNRWCRVRTATGCTDANVETNARINCHGNPGRSARIRESVCDKNVHVSRIGIVGSTHDELLRPAANKKPLHDDRKRWPGTGCRLRLIFPPRGGRMEHLSFREVDGTGCYGVTGPDPSAVLDKRSVKNAYQCSTHSPSLSRRKRGPYNGTGPNAGTCFVEPSIGLEPTTCSLRVSCSTN